MITKKDYFKDLKLNCQKEKGAIVLVKFITKKRKIKLKDFVIDFKITKDIINFKFVDEIFIIPTKKWVGLYDDVMEQEVKKLKNKNK